MHTDGISVSLHYEKMVAKSLECYVNELSEEQKRNYAGKRIIGIDIGKRNLLQCVSLKENLKRQRRNRPQNIIQLRYTSDKREFDTKIRSSQKREENRKKGMFIDDKSVKDWESGLADVSRFRYSDNPAEYEVWINRKRVVLEKCKDFYNDPLRRKIRLYNYMNTQRSEAAFMKKFMETFGGPKKVVVCIGNYSSGSYHLPGCPPCKGVGFRKMFRRWGYTVLLVDEFRTSCKCYNCGCDGSDGKNEKFVRRNGRMEHHVLRCKKCRTIWDRDINGALNIYRLADLELKGMPRPDPFNRPRKKEEEETGEPPPSHDAELTEATTVAAAVASTGNNARRRRGQPRKVATTQATSDIVAARPKRGRPPGNAIDSSTTTAGRGRKRDHSDDDENESALLPVASASSKRGRPLAAPPQSQ
jgi:hypothetical protein